MFKFSLLCVNLVVYICIYCCLIHAVSLIHAGVPGGYDERYNHMIPTVADIFWCFKKREECNNLVVNAVAIVTSSELKFVKYKVDLGNIEGPFFHNKYYMELDHTVMDCLEQQLINRNIKEYESECKS